MKIIFLVMIFLVGCQGKSENSTQVGADFKVEKLFTHEGCTIYRFNDGMYSRYYTNCGSAFWQESCGKNCSRPMEVGGK